MFQGKFKIEKKNHFEALKWVKGYYIKPANEYLFAMNNLF